MVLYKGQIPIAGLTSPIAPTKSMGQIIESKIPLVDAGLHLLDGTLVRGDGVYKAFVDKIAELYTLDPTAEYFCAQVEWEDSVFNYGVCEKFVYDSTYNTVRLPKMYSDERYLIKSYSEGTNWYRIYSDGWCEQGGRANVSSYGATINFLKPFKDTNYSLSGLEGTPDNPDYTANYYYVTLDTDYCILYVKGYGGQGTSHGTMWQARGYIDILTYEKSPNYLYIVLATASKTNIEVDIDEITTDLNGKADVDLTNVNNQAKILMSGMGMPSSRHFDLVIGASGTTYTAPANGWFLAGGIPNATGGFMEIYNATTTMSGTIVRSAQGGDVWFERQSTPVSKGDLIYFNYGGLTPNFLRFIYAKGSESEAQ